MIRLLGGAVLWKRARGIAERIRTTSSSIQIWKQGFIHWATPAGVSKSTDSDILIVTVELGALTVACLGSWMLHTSSGSAQNTQNQSNVAAWNHPENPQESSDITIFRLHRPSGSIFRSSYQTRLTRRSENVKSQPTATIRIKHPLYDVRMQWFRDLIRFFIKINKFVCSCYANQARSLSGIRSLCSPGEQITLGNTLWYGIVFVPFFLVIGSVSNASRRFLLGSLLGWLFVYIPVISRTFWSNDPRALALCASGSFGVTILGTALDMPSLVIPQACLTILLLGMLPPVMDLPLHSCEIYTIDNAMTGSSRGLGNRPEPSIIPMTWRTYQLYYSVCCKLVFAQVVRLLVLMFECSLERGKVRIRWQCVSRTSPQ